MRAILALIVLQFVLPITVLGSSITYTGRPSWVEGYIFDQDNEPVEDAIVYISEPIRGVFSRDDGYFELSFVPEGTYGFTVSKEGYSDLNIYDIYVNGKDRVSLGDLTIVEDVDQAKAILKGGVYDTKDEPIGDAVVVIWGMKWRTKTDEAGEFTFDEVPVGKRVVKVDVHGYKIAKTLCEVFEGETNFQRIILEEKHAITFTPARERVPKVFPPEKTGDESGE